MRASIATSGAASDLREGAVDVWRADLDRPSDVDLTTLSPAELGRAADFRLERARLRWTAARAILRHLLGGYLDRDARELEFVSGTHGKPALPGDPIDFNLSHSAGTALFAFAIENPIGVDVELAGRERDTLGVAERAFAPDELERLRELSGAERQHEFLRLWVRHEAVLKCRGTRLRAPVEPDSLSIIDLDVGPGAAAAVALEREQTALSLQELV